MGAVVALRLRRRRSVKIRIPVLIFPSLAVVEEARPSETLVKEGENLPRRSRVKAGWIADRKKSKISEEDRPIPITGGLSVKGMKDTENDT